MKSDTYSETYTGWLRGDDDAEQVFGLFGDIFDPTWPTAESAQSCNPARARGKPAKRVRVIVTVRIEAAKGKP